MSPYIKFFAFYSKENLIHIRVLDFNEVARKAQRQAEKKGRKLPEVELSDAQKSALSTRDMMEKRLQEVKDMSVRGPQEAAAKKQEIERITALYDQFKAEFKEILPSVMSANAAGDDDDDDDMLEDGNDYEELYKMGQKMNLSRLSIVTCADFESGTKQLHQLAKQNNIAQMQIRLQAGSDIDGLNNLKLSPVDYAIASYHLESVKFLIANGARLDFKGRRSAPLHYAAGVGDAEIFEYLLKEANAPITSRDQDGDTPLHYACAAGNIDFVKPLIVGRRIDVQNHLGDTPLHYACAMGQTKVVEMLLQLGASPNIANKEGQNCFHILTDKERVDKCARTVRDTDATQKRAANVPRRPFPDTSKENYSKIIQLLVQHGGNINARNLKGRTPLSITVEKEQPEMIDMWLSQGADPNICDQTSHSLLASVLGDHFINVAHNLLNHKIDASQAKNAVGLDAIHVAIRAGDPELIRKMVAAGSNVNALDEELQSPLHLICSYNYLKVIQGLKTEYNENKLHPEAFGPNGFNYLGTAHALIECGAHIEARDKLNYTPLLHAARVGDFEMVELLLLHGADITAQTAHGMNALHLVCRLAASLDSLVIPSREGPQQHGSGKKIRLVFKKPQEVPRFLRTAEVLIHYGVDMNETCNFGRSPLLMARELQYKELAKLLEDKGARDHATDVYAMMQGDLKKIMQDDLKKLGASL